MQEKSIDLNCDLGESYGVYKISHDDAVMPYISSANIACGWHAGDPMVMNTSVQLAGKHKVNCGAHPGYPDLLGFGRRGMKVNAEELKYYLMYQIGALDGFCKINSIRLSHVKPHGSLYLTAVESVETAVAVAEAISLIDQDLVFVTFAGSKGQMMARVGKEFGLKVAYEAFPDRAYTPEGTLAPRYMEGAVITDPDEVIARAETVAANGCIEAINGELIELEAHTLCVHGDNPQAVEMVKKIRSRLEERNIKVKPLDAGALN